jgi:hypothetical protein
MLARLGLRSRGFDADVELVNAAFRALAAGGDRLRWEPFFFDWFCGDEARAMQGPRGGLYGEAAFADFRREIANNEPTIRERLLSDYFRRDEPEEMLIEEVEALWAPIAERDDWGPFYAKLERIGRARVAYGLSG